MSLDQEDAEVHFLKTYGIIRWDQNIKLNDDRKTLEQNITLGFASKEELLKQIKVELNLLDICQLKIDQEMRVNNNREISTEVLVILSNRLSDIYNALFSLYPVEKTSLSEYLEFWSNNKLYITKCSNILESLMSRYHSDPEVYIIGANYAFDDLYDIETSRRYFVEGLKYHEESKIIHIAEFWIEVQHLEKTAGASLPVAIEKYRYIIKRFGDDLGLHLIIIDKALQLNSVRKLQFIVVRDMVEKYKHSELMWAKLARINFDGFIYYRETEQLQYNKNYMSGILSCIKTYEDGLNENLPSINKYNLWNFYIDHVIEIRNSHRMKNEAVRNFMNETMERAFQEAHDNNAIRKAEHYIYWAENTNKDSYKILEESVNVIRNSAKLWTKLLSYYIDIENFGMAIEAFRAGVYCLNNDSLPLWKMIILYMKYTGSELLQSFYEEGARFPFEKINTYVISNYLEWCLLQNGIKAARDLFNKLIHINPKCKSLYEIMIQYELSHGITLDNKNSTRSMHNCLCTHYGKKEIGVWIDCMRFENDYGMKHLVFKIYEASISYLPAELGNIMVEEYKKLKVEFGDITPDDENVIVIDD